MNDLPRRALLVVAAAHLVLLPTGALTFWRSATFAIAAALAAVVVARRRARLPLPGAAAVALLAAWSAWTLASVAWSVDPSYSAAEWRSDVLWGVATLAVFHVAAASAPDAFARLAASALAALAFWTALALGIALSVLGWETRPLHRGDGAFATYLVTTAPLIALLAWPPPAGLRGDARGRAAAFALFALLLVVARGTESRMLWVALACGAATLFLCTPGVRHARLLTAFAALLAVLAVLFVDTVQERAADTHGAGTSVGSALEADPRLAIWKHAGERIRERPWLGHGYGLHILGDRFGADTGNATIRHPHNLLVGQWLQTGAIGVALFVAMLAAIGWRFTRYVRSADGALAGIGAVGLAVLVAYMARNLTDDFFLRANGRLLFATLGLLLGAGALRAREIGVRPSFPDGTRAGGFGK
jgi:O-antigen ligase